MREERGHQRKQRGNVFGTCRQCRRWDTAGRQRRAASRWENQRRGDVIDPRQEAADKEEEHDDEQLQKGPPRFSTICQAWNNATKRQARSPYWEPAGPGCRMGRPGKALASAKSLEGSSLFLCMSPLIPCGDTWAQKTRVLKGNLKWLFCITSQQKLGKSRALKPELWSSEQEEHNVCWLHTFASKL